MLVHLLYSRDDECRPSTTAKKRCGFQIITPFHGVTDIIPYYLPKCQPYFASFFFLSLVPQHLVALLFFTTKNDFFYLNVITIK